MEQNAISFVDPLLIIIVVVILAAVVGYWAFRSRQKQPPKAPVGEAGEPDIPR